MQVDVVITEKNFSKVRFISIVKLKHQGCVESQSNWGITRQILLPSLARLSWHPRYEKALTESDNFFLRSGKR